MTPWSSSKNIPEVSLYYLCFSSKCSGTSCLEEVLLRDNETTPEVSQQVGIPNQGDESLASPLTNLPIGQSIVALTESGNPAAGTTQDPSIRPLLAHPRVSSNPITDG